MRPAVTTFRIACRNLGGRPGGRLVDMADGAGIRRTSPGGQIRSRNAKRMIGAPVVAHVDLLRGMAVDALRPCAALGMEMMLTRIIGGRSNARKHRTPGRRVALRTQGVALLAQAG